LVIKNWHPTPKIIKKENKLIRVLWIANLKPIKRHYLFLELTEKLKKIDNVEFIIIGRSEKKGFSNDIIKYKNVIYLGEISQEEVNIELSKSHILVNTSISEGFSNTFIQAWMRSVPVVSLNVNPDNIIPTEKIGFISLTIEQLILDVEKLILNHKLRSEMANKSRLYAAKHHSINNVNTLLKQVFNK
jgi:glycosyltransferase involved in cell wall biosynthesis